MGEDGWKKMTSTSEAKETWRRGALVEGFCVWKKPCEEEEERSRGLVGFLEEESWIEVVVSVSKPASNCWLRPRDWLRERGCRSGLERLGDLESCLEVYLRCWKLALEGEVLELKLTLGRRLGLKLRRLGDLPLRCWFIWRLGELDTARPRRGEVEKREERRSLLLVGSW